MMQQPAAPSDANEMKTELWLGDLAPWMDEQYIQGLFPPTDVIATKLMRNKQTGQSEQYAFLTCASQDSAQRILDTYNGVVMPGTTDQVFRINWAAYGVGRTNNVHEYSLFVGDVAPDVTDYTLQEAFRHFFPSVRSAKVMTDPQTGKSRGYGFVRFSDETERDHALVQMNGQLLSNRSIRVSLATAKKSSLHTHGAGLSVGDLDTSITTLFIGGLSSNVSESELRMLFSAFGEIIYVKIPPGKGCGFVQYTDRAQAERAMAAMHGQVIGHGAVRISWGRASNRPVSGVSSMVGANGLAMPPLGAFDAALGTTLGGGGTLTTSAATAALTGMYGNVMAPPSLPSIPFTSSGLSLSASLGALSQAPPSIQVAPPPQGCDPIQRTPQPTSVVNGTTAYAHQATLLGNGLFA